MKRIFFVILSMLLLASETYAVESNKLFDWCILKNNTRQIRSLLNSQVRYANRENFDKFISTYDKDYVNSDGFNLDTFSKIVTDVWEIYEDIDYDIKIKDISVDGDKAVVKLLEYSYADLPETMHMPGVLQGESNSVYYLKKENGKWKVSSDEVLSEETTMLFGDAKNLDVKLTAPNTISSNSEYTASLEFVPPENVVAFASIASNKVEYPQGQPKEVFRRLPEDNLLERLFVSNDENANEYIVASFGLAKADLEDFNLKISFTGCGYKIIRVNVLPNEGIINNDNDELK